MPGRKASAQRQEDQAQLSLAMPLLALAALPPELCSHGTHSPKATVELQYFTWLFFFFPPHAHEAEMGSGVKLCRAAKPCARSGPCSAHRHFRASRKAKLQDKEQKSQGNVTSIVISTHAKVPSARFFFFPFEISNSSLWTKSCLSENIDLRPLTKLHLKQSRGLFFPLPTDLSAQSLDLPGSCRKFLHWSTPLVLAQRGFCT